MLSKSNTPQVDIIIICYNQQEYISETIESAINQSYENKRIIIADDCSSDQSRKIIDQWFTKYPDKIIPYFNKQSSKLSVTRSPNHSNILWKDSSPCGWEELENVRRNQ